MHLHKSQSLMSGDNTKEGDRKKGRKGRYRGEDVKNGHDTDERKEGGNREGRCVNEIATVSHVCASLCRHCRGDDVYRSAQTVSLSLCDRLSGWQEITLPLISKHTEISLIKANV